MLVVAPDRPGCGRSEPVPAGAALDWPADVAVLAEAIGLTTFAVLGVADGGRLAAACARDLADRVTSLALVGGPPVVHGLALPRRHWRATSLDGAGLAPVYRWFRETTAGAQRGESAGPHAGSIETPRIPCGDTRSEPHTESRRPSP